MVMAFGRRSQDICLLPPDPGQCDGELIVTYYDPTAMQCKELLWSGCGGNFNRFESIVKCELFCDGVRSNPSGPPVDEIPLQEIGGGDPEKSVVRYSFENQEAD